MRTLLHIYATFKVGGPQMRFAHLANHFGGAYRHVVVAMDGQTEAAARLAPDLNVELRTTPTTRGGSIWSNLKACRGLLDEVRPDLMVTSNWGSIEWALANLDARTPHLHMEDGFGPEEALRQLPRRVWTRRLALRRSMVLLPSMTLERMARNVWRLPQRRLIHTPNGVDCARFARKPDPAFAAACGIPDDGLPVVGTVAALRGEKNLYRLLDAFALATRRRAARLVIVGDGEQRDGLTARAAALGLAERVVFTGACPTPERLLPSFSLFALSSDTEQMPISVLEAMAAGLPLAATAVGDVAAMVAPGNRPFIVAKDADALAGAIGGLLDNPSRARSVGRANAVRARAEFDQRLMFKAYRRLFDGAWG
jgi:glycosyltransferase involved in cell wall biosynthesis